MVFVPGHDDEFARKYLGTEFGGVEVVGGRIHETADACMLRVTHSDRFDGVIQCAKWLAHVGDMVRLRHLRPRRAELGRSCTHPQRRSGGVILALRPTLPGALCGATR